MRFFTSGSIRTQMLVLISAVLLLQIVISGIIFSALVADFLKNQIGDKALRIAETLAAMPMVQEAAAKGDQDGQIQKTAEEIRIKTGARYVVVADKNEIRLSHPVPENIGKKFSGGDTEDALKYGISYVSDAVGTLGPSIRGIVPIYYNDKIEGFVAVGYLKENIRETILEHQMKPILFILMMVATGLGAAFYIANRQKKITLGLEPAEIADLFVERTAILDSIRAGIIAINPEKQIRMINTNAKKSLGIKTDVIGHPLSEIFPESYAERVLTTQETLEDTEIIVGGISVLCNILPVKYMNELHGAVITFRRKNELAVLAQELNRVKETSDMLRVQSHEYSNKLHTIAGLIQVGAYQEAQDLILSETQTYQDMLTFLSETVPDSVVSAVIMGKYNRARELKIDFSIAKDSRMRDIPKNIDRKKLVTILGNLLDNAFDAVQNSPNKAVLLSMSDVGGQLVFKVEDSGGGIDMRIAENLFEKGISTKGDDRGVGLYLVQRALIEMRGSVSIAKSGIGGAMFRISIPKEQI